jgi:hypothetical protein
VGRLRSDRNFDSTDKGGVLEDNNRHLVERTVIRAKQSKGSSNALCRISEGDVDQEFGASHTPPRNALRVVDIGEGLSGHHSNSSCEFDDTKHICDHSSGKVL